MAKFKTGFYAYPSGPASLKEIIEKAVDRLGDKKRLRQVRLRTWTQLPIDGRFVIGQILSAIDDADIFACDLTHPNPNVMFELGYAIGNRKRLWISVYAHDTEAKDTLHLLRSTLVPDVGYIAYGNSQELADAFISTKPWTTVDEHLLGPGFSFKAHRPPYYSLYYHTQPYVTEESLRLTEALQSSPFSQGLFIDDPRENPSATLSWYAQRIRDSDAFIVQLLSSTQDGNSPHNLRGAFLAGLAYALYDKKNVLLLAPDPYETPLDYRTILVVHGTAEACARTATSWLSDVQSRIPRKIVDSGTRDDSTRHGWSILDLNVGEHIAEHERNSLAAYYVPTGSYTMALVSEQAIFVGRRGTGKSATLYALARHFLGMVGNHVCIINPVGYEIDGVIRVLQEISHRTEKGYLLESLWRLLVFSELALSVATEVRSRGPAEAHLLTDAEQNLLRFVQENRDFLDVPFSVRVDQAVAPLLGLSNVADPREQRLRISERLHAGLIRDLRGILGEALGNRKKVVILIDNLDESWAPGVHVEYLADLLSGLLKVAKDIVDEFHRTSYWRRPVNATVNVFIRSDIFYHVRRLTIEQDKLPLHLLYWDNPEMLLQVIDQRLEYASDRRLGAAEIWRTMFPEAVAGMNPRDFLVQFTLPRPRHLIWFMQEAIVTAINKGHRSVTEEDLFDARRHYSEFALTSIQAEDDPRRGRLKSVLIKFAGRPSVLSRPDVDKAISDAGVSPEDIDFYIDLLCDLSFLGIGTADGFRYPRHEAEREHVRELAREVALRRVRPGAQEEYEVNRVFHDALQILNR